MKALFVLWLLTLNIFYIYPQEGKQFKYEDLVQFSSAELIKKGNGYLKKNEEDTAVMFYMFLSSQYNERMNVIDQYLCAISCDKLGTIYYQKKNYSKAFESFLRGVKISERHHFQNLLPNFYKNIGNLYCVFQDYDRGNAHYEKALAICTEQGDVDMQIKVLSNLSSMCCYAGNPKKARSYYRRMREKSPGAKERILMEYYSVLDLGVIYGSEQKYDSAVICYKTAARYAIRFKLEPLYECVSYCELATLYEEMGQQDSALHYFSKNEKMTRENQMADMLIETLRSLARIYGQRKDKQKEQLYKGQYLALSDSIFNFQEIGKVKREQFMYEMDQTKGEMESLNEEKLQKELKIKAQQKVLFGVSLGLVLFIVMLALVYNQKRKLRIAYKDLFKRNSEILKSEEQSRKSHLEYECKLEEERERNRYLTERLKQLMVSSEENNLLPIAVAEDKSYSVDKLTDGQKENIRGRKVNCVMLCFTLKLIGRGSASAKGVHQHSRRA